MPATVRYDEQYCPIARALDVLGDRWTLLILRELVIGDQRFTDLRDHLPGIAPTLLTQRLRSMAEQGLLATKELPPPAARSVYTITDRGRQAIPVMRALAKWGMPLLEEPEDDQVVRAWTAINGTVATYYDPVAAVGIDERYLFRIGDQEATLSTRRGGGSAHETPDLVIESPGRVWIDIRQGRTTLQAAIDDGVITVEGDDAALANFARIYQFDRSPT
ncbi:MAG: transcriptional regulator [Ilumatobacteraceae bacterium]|nr:transcriptional regulator [Ilumatobacteraceae bacterium]